MAEPTALGQSHKEGISAAYNKQLLNTESSINRETLNHETVWARHWKFSSEIRRPPRRSTVEYVYGVESWNGSPQGPL